MQHFEVKGKWWNYRTHYKTLIKTVLWASLV
jgi:hypothetical protein